jgi:ferredoxin
MAYKITDACICCAQCIQECPNQAITEGEKFAVIDPNKCTECVGFFPNQQCSTVCAVDAPAPDPTHKESREQLLAKFQKLHLGQAPKS